MEEWVHYRASHRIDRKFFSNSAAEVYKAHLAKDLHPARKQPSKIDKAVDYFSPRDAFNKRVQTKINLRPLIAEGNHKQLEGVICTLLERIYFFAPFEIKEREKEVLKILKETLKKHPECVKFHQLLAFIPEEKYPLFYKLIKGTQNYKIYTTIGYPPIGDFLEIEKILSSEHPIHFCYASRPVLEAVLGSTISPLIINEEKHKWEKDHKHTPLTKQEFEALLLSYRLNPADYEPLFSFGREQQPPFFDVIHDLEAKIQIKIEK